MLNDVVAIHPNARFLSLFSRDINWNFSVPALREWYTSTHAHFIEDGMDFWWNDEGETAWFTVSHCTHRGGLTPACPRTISC